MEKQFTKDIQKWLYDNGFDVEFTIGDDCYYNISNDVVMFSLEKPLHIEGFLDYASSLGLTGAISWVAACLLHELGHYETLWQIPMYKIRFDELIKRVVETDSYTVLGMDIKSSIYYRLPTEKEATMWFVDYVNNNDISELESIIKKYYLLFK